MFKNQIVEKNIVLKLLQKSEEGNTRITNKIHETLIDLSFNPKIGESLTSSFINIESPNQGEGRDELFSLLANGQFTQDEMKNEKVLERIIKLSAEFSTNKSEAQCINRNN